MAKKKARKKLKKAGRRYGGEGRSLSRYSFGVSDTHKPPRPPKKVSKA